MDVSSSMQESTRDGRTKLEAATAAARAFAREMQRDTGSRIGIVSFAAEAQTVLDLATDPASVERALSSLEPGRQTCIPCALEEAEAAFERAPAHEDAVRAIVLLTDGRSNPRPVDEAIPIAERMHAAGITIVTIGLGDELERDALREIASWPSGFYEAPDAEDLAAIYEQVAVEIPCPAGSFWGRR
jgi:Mg-chelatase subunit ChlD